jgi:hypothetical protein
MIPELPGAVPEFYDFATPERERGLLMSRRSAAG